MADEAGGRVGRLRGAGVLRHRIQALRTLAIGVGRPGAIGRAPVLGVFPPLFLGLAVLLAAIAVVTGCDHDKKTGPPPVGPCGEFTPQTSPTNVLALLRLAYEERNIDEYTKLFATDFVFVFEADGIDPEYPTPAQWGLADELLSAQHMFADERVTLIRLDFEPGTPEPADSVTYGPRTWKVMVPAANVEVHTRSTAGDTLTYEVPGTLEAFYFREDPTHPACDGRPTWYIVRWEDKPIGVTKAEEITWGALKARFH